MAAGSTYTPIATTTVSGSSTTSYVFTSIPSTYTDLILIINGGTAASGIDCNFRVGNGSIDTGSNYSRTAVAGNGSAASSTRASNVTFSRFNFEGYYENSISTAIVAQFMNYSNTTTNKTVLSRSNNAINGTSAVVSLWRSTSAINQIEVYVSASNFLAGSTFTLYGIAAA